MTHLYLIEHAAAAGYKQGRSTWINPGLSQEGIAQARRLRDRLLATQEIQADVLISSPLARASETAALLAPSLGLPIVIDDQFEEFRLGEGEGVPDEKLIELAGGVFSLEDQPFRRVAPGGDSLAEFNMRLCAAYDRITRTYEGKTIVLVGHGWVIQASFIYCMGLNMLRTCPVGIQSTAITHWYKGPTSESPQPRWQLKRHADAAHLSLPQKIS